MSDRKAPASSHNRNESLKHVSRFANLHDGGRQLAEKLRSGAHLKNPIVLAIARGAFRVVAKSQPNSTCLSTCCSSGDCSCRAGQAQNFARSASAARWFSTIEIAIQAVRKLNPKRITAAVPVASPEGYALIRRLADQVVCLAQPEPFGHAGMCTKISADPTRKTCTRCSTQSESHCSTPYRRHAPA